LTGTALRPTWPERDLWEKRGIGRSKAMRHELSRGCDPARRELRFQNVPSHINFVVQALLWRLLMALKEAVPTTTAVRS
jgi:hypothetical protein